MARHISSKKKIHAINAKSSVIVLLGDFMEAFLVHNPSAYKVLPYGSLRG
jgi:hypothetical protein